ncbi:MAG: hypothetical protein ACRDRK_00670 [Pseudonocardia sp.]
MSRLVALSLGVVVVLGGCAQRSVLAPQVTADGVRRIELTVAGAGGGAPVRVAVPVGSTVELVVRSDVADEVHLHGYDRSSFVTAGASTTLRFVADIAGVFEVELEQRGDRLVRLEVA